MSSITDKLNAQRLALVSYVFQAQASTPDQERDLEIVLHKANALEGIVNALILQDVEVAQLDLKAQSDALDKLATRIQKEAKTIAEVEDVIDIAAQVVALAAQIAVLVAA